MHEILFSIGPFTVYSYGFMIAVGFLAAIATGVYRAKRSNLNADLVWGMAFIGIVGGLIGAKLLFYITTLDEIIRNPRLLLDVSNGFVVYGGIIGGVLAAWLYCRKQKTKFVPYLDLLLPSVSIAQGFGRIGCLLAGCCYGRPTDAWYGITFTNSSFAPNGVPLVPTQILSSVGDFAIAFILIWMASRNKREGVITENFLILYGIGRFLIEFLRNDPRGQAGILSTSQWISIPIVLLGVGLKIWNTRET